MFFTELRGIRRGLGFDGKEVDLSTVLTHIMTIQVELPGTYKVIYDQVVLFIFTQNSNLYMKCLGRTSKGCL